MTTRALTLTLAAAAVAMFATTPTASHAAECPMSTTDAFELDADAVVALYDCIKDYMAEGYASQGDETGSSYRNWSVTSTRPAVAGAHGNRFLQTFANDLAAPVYLQFAEEGVAIPAGGVLAKESFSIHKKKKIGRRGPLFIMTKLEAGGAPDYGDWLYAGLQPNGKPMKIKQSFCHDCHAAWEEQDYLAYPLEEVRLGQ